MPGRLVFSTSRWSALPAFAAATLMAVALWWTAGREAEVVDAPSPQIPCLSYAPYRGGQTPFDPQLVIPAAQIEQDLVVLAPLTSCVRTYSTSQGLDVVPEIAARLGMVVLLGVWIGREPDKNGAEIARGVDLANRYPETVRAVVVGNEVLLRREQPAAYLKALIRDVRAAVPVPTTYADVWEFWTANPGLAEAVDFVMIHTLPYWEDDPVGVDKAVEHVIVTHDRVQALMGDKPVMIGEAGWPSAGRQRRDALPSRLNQAKFVRELLRHAHQEGFEVNLIEAFDQPWKRRLEGTVGGHWGLFDSDRTPKFAATGPVPRDPLWLWRFATVAAIAAAILAGVAAWQSFTLPAWLAISLVAYGGASAIVVAAHGLALSAHTFVGWLVGGLTLVLAVVTPLVVGAVALARPGEGSFLRPAPIENVGVILRARTLGFRSPLTVALGALRLLVLLGVAATTLALLFEPRYRDFPTAAYLPAVAAVMALAWFNRGAEPPSSDLREERLLGLCLVLGAVAVVLNEGVSNLQALGWAAIAAALGVTVWWDGRARRR